VLDEGKPTVVILMGGSAMDVSEAEARADAVFLAWYPRARGGRAVAELLFGQASPSGKLPVTFYRDEALTEMPDFTDYSMKNRTYRYYTGTPLYPFGYGLSYADIVLTGLEADRERARLTLENRSGFAAEQVAELYLRNEGDADAHHGGEADDSRDGSGGNTYG
jgi:beta-glucosidase